MDPTIYNPVQNICRLFHFLARLLFTTNETELDYYNKSVRVASRVPGRQALRSQEIWEFEENP